MQNPQSERLAQTNIKLNMSGRKKFKFTSIILTTTIVILGVLTLYFLMREIQSPSDIKTGDGLKTISGDSASPIPLEFQEMTIPYLRSRVYKSTLGDQEVSYQSPNYTAYLTSYISDGFKVNGLLTIPSLDKPENGFPAIIFIHGYIPPTLYQTTQNYYDYVDYLARSGLVVFKIDLRGHGTSEGEADGGYYSSDYVIDVLNAISALKAADFINPKSIGLWGHSMAGNIVLRSFAAKPDMPAVVIWAGAVYTYTDLQEYGINDNSYRPPQNASERQRKRQRLKEVYGDPIETSEFWKQVIPTNYINDLAGAIQIHHATNDDVVNVKYSRNLNKLLDKTSLPHELYEYSSGGHNITGGSFSQAMQRTVDFFKENLK